MASILQFVRKVANPSSRNEHEDRGISVHEMVVTTAIMSLLIVTSGAAVDTWLKTSRTNQERTIALQEGRMIGDRMSKEIRMATGQTQTRYMATTPSNCTTNPLAAYSNTYKLIEAGPTSLAFYKEPATGGIVRVRFSRDSDNRMWMATRNMTPSNPSQGNEITVSAGVSNTRTVVNGVAGSPSWIFRYLSDTASPLATGPSGYLGCRELTQVSQVDIVLYVDQDPNLAIGASTIETTVFIRSAGFWK